MITSITLKNLFFGNYPTNKIDGAYGEKDTNDLYSHLSNSIDNLNEVQWLIFNLNKDLNTNDINAIVFNCMGKHAKVKVYTKKKRTYYISGLTIHEED